MNVCDGQHRDIATQQAMVLYQRQHEGAYFNHRHSDGGEHMHWALRDDMPEHVKVSSRNKVAHHRD